MCQGVFGGFLSELLWASSRGIRTHSPLRLALGCPFAPLDTFSIADFIESVNTFFKKFSLCPAVPSSKSVRVRTTLWFTFLYRTTGLHAVGGLWREGLTRFSWSILFFEVAFPPPYTYIIAGSARMSSVFFNFFCLGWGGYVRRFRSQACDFFKS